jgi:hypothetical protein
LSCTPNTFDSDGDASNGCEAGCDKIPGGECGTCSSTNATNCTSILSCHANKFNVNNDSTDGCEAGCAIVPGGTCFECRDTFASGCVTVICDSGKFDSNNEASSGCTSDTGLVIAIVLIVIFVIGMFFGGLFIWFQRRETRRDEENEYQMAEMTRIQTHIYDTDMQHFLNPLEQDQFVIPPHELDLMELIGQVRFVFVF